MYSQINIDWNYFMNCLYILNYFTILPAYQLKALTKNKYHNYNVQINWLSNKMNNAPTLQ